MIDLYFKKSWSWYRNVDIAHIDLNGKITRIDHMHNEIKDVAVDLMRDALHGVVTDLQIKYLAWGGSNTANNTGQTKLVSEFGRKAITSQVNGGTGELITLTYVAPAEANTPKIEELGWFAGPLATTTTDSGIIIGRVLYSHQKTALEALQIARTDAFVGV
jgi:hypothetical protein